MSRNARPMGGSGAGAYGGSGAGGGGGGGNRQPSRGSGATGGTGGGGGGSNNRRSQSVSKDLVTRAYNNNIIVKNEDGEYAPIGTILPIT